MEDIKLKKTIYSLQNFNNVVNTKFTQLVNTSVKETPIENDTSVNKFFNDYDTLFYKIPLSGSEESHLGLASRSFEYLGLSIEDLQNEINDLREENITLRNQIFIASTIDTGSLI